MIEKPSTSHLNKLALFRSISYTPHPGQLEVHNSTAPRRIVACGARWGKSLCAAAEAVAAALQPAQRSIGWICAPTYDLCDRVFREIVVIVAEHLRHRIVTLKESEKRLIVRNMAGGLSEIRGKSADNPVSLLGEGLDWLIVDEAARLKPVTWQSYLSQRLIDKHGWALLISTPKNKGWFHEMYRRGQGNDPDYQSWNCPSWSNPHLNRALIEQERSRLPDRVFRQEFGGEFIEGSGSVFRNVRECATITDLVLKPDPDASYFMGLDLAKVDDFTVAVVLDENRRVVFANRFNKMDWSAQLIRIKTIAHAFDANVLVDSTGVGDPILESLLQAGCRAEGYVFSQRSKAQLIDNLALLFEQRNISIPTERLWPELVDELESFQYSITENGAVRTGAPSGVHDDTVIALALAAWQVRPFTRPSAIFAHFSSGGLIMRSTSSDDDDEDESGELLGNCSAGQSDTPSE